MLVAIKEFLYSGTEEALEEIEKLPEIQRMVLYKHYIQRKRLRKIAEEEYYTPTYIREVHSAALKAIEKNIHFS